MIPFYKSCFCGTLLSFSEYFGKILFRSDDISVFGALSVACYPGIEFLWGFAYAKCANSKFDKTSRDCHVV